jgi:hypothetical protein
VGPSVRPGKGKKKKRGPAWFLGQKRCWVSLAYSSAGWLGPRAGWLVGRLTYPAGVGSEFVAGGTSSGFIAPRAAMGWRPAFLLLSSGTLGTRVLEPQDCGVAVSCTGHRNSGPAARHGVEGRRQLRGAEAARRVPAQERHKAGWGEGIP